jgi:two-component system, NarL family, sensor histidine kinase UhpB
MTELHAFTKDYYAALQSYLEGAGEVALVQAYDLGRRALDDHKGVLDMAVVQHDALIEVFRDRTSPSDVVSGLKAAQEFLIEVLSPYEMAHRGFRETAIVLRGLNERQEEEAHRIAHLLHDDVGQLLVAVRLALDQALRTLPDAAKERFRKVETILESAHNQVRCLSHELRPLMLDDLGLQAALDALCSGISERSGLEVRLVCPDRERLPQRVETVLYRVVQEALTNASKYAKASEVIVRVEVGPQLVTCSVRDNGLGFVQQENKDRPSGGTGIGLIGMRERLEQVGGTLKIRSTPGQGTEIVAEIPLKEPPQIR